MVFLEELGVDGFGGGGDGWREEAALAVGIDEHGDGGGRGARVGLEVLVLDLFFVELAADDFSPSVIADVGEDAGLDAEAAEGDADVAGDAAAGGRDGFDRDGLVGADRVGEIDAQAGEVDDAGAADDCFGHRAVVSCLVSGRILRCGLKTRSPYLGLLDDEPGVEEVFFVVDQGLAGLAVEDFFAGF